MIQLENALKNKDGYCCLGVLGCVLGVPDEKMINFTSKKISEVIPNLPEDLNTSECFIVTEKMMVDILTKMNDGKTQDGKMSNFHEISEWIKENVEFV